MKLGLKKLPAVFFRTRAGTEPVREWLQALPREERRIIGEDIADVEYAWPIGLPLCRPMSRGLWEVRSNLPGNRIARVLFCIAGGNMVLLPGFIKKTARTLNDDLALARKRMKETQS
jgi:phage-related protein